MLLTYLLKCQSKTESASEILSDETLNADTPDSVTPDILKSGAMTPDAFTPTPDAEDPSTKHHVLSGASDQPLAAILRELASQVNRTELPLTGNSLDGEQEPVDNKTERQKVQERGKDGGKALCDVDMDVDEEVSEIKEDKDQKGLPDVDNEEIENKASRNSGTLNNTNLIDNLHTENVQESVQEQITARTPQDESSECASEINTEPKERRKGEVSSTDNTESEDEDKRSERMCVERNGEQHREKYKAQRDKPTETPAESLEESGQAERQVSEGEEGSADNPGSEKRTSKENERLTCGQDRLDYSQEGDSEYVMAMVESVDQGLSVIEEEARMSNRRHSRRKGLADESNEAEEITGKQKEPNEMAETNELQCCYQRMLTDEQAQESDMGNESSGNMVGVEPEAEPCNDHTLKDVLDRSTSAQEEFLSPEEIYKVSEVFIN